MLRVSKHSIRYKDLIYIFYTIRFDLRGSFGFIKFLIYSTQLKSENFFIQVNFAKILGKIALVKKSLAKKNGLKPTDERLGRNVWIRSKLSRDGQEEPTWSANA